MRLRRHGRYRFNMNYHDLSKEDLLDVLSAAEDLVVAFVDINDPNKGASRDDRIVLVTDQKDAEGNYILVVAQLDSTGLVGGRRLNVNRTITAYGEERIARMVTDAIADGRILNMKKANNPLSEGGQFPNRLTVDDLKKNIQRFWDNVNWKNAIDREMKRLSSTGEAQNYAFAAAWKISF